MFVILATKPLNDGTKGLDSTSWVRKAFTEKGLRLLGVGVSKMVIHSSSITWVKEP